MKIQYPYMATPTAQWISLMDYATRHDVSLSTLRRHIKANKVEFKVENGRYLILDGSSGVGAVSARGQNEMIAFESHSKVFELERDLQRAREEIAELKTLIAFYEESLHSNPTRSN